MDEAPTAPLETVELGSEALDTRITVEEAETAPPLSVVTGSVSAIAAVLKFRREDEDDGLADMRGAELLMGVDDL